MADEPEKETLTTAVELEETSQSKRRIKFTVPFDEVQKEFDAVYNEVKDIAQIPGFRPGKAPRRIVEMRMGKAFVEDALSRIRGRALGQAVMDHKLRVVGSPQFENIAYEKGQPFTFEATMEVIPDIALPEYKGIKIERREPAATTEEDVSAELDRLRERFAKLELVEGRPLRDGDFALVSYEEEADGRTEKFERRIVEIAEDALLPGFAEKVRGMRPGEKREFQIHIPEDYQDKEAAGKVVNYNLQLAEIRTKTAPQADDELAKMVGLESLEELREHIRKRLTEGKERDAEEDEINQIMTYLLRNTDFEVPESLMTEETRRRASAKVEAAFRSGMSAELVREKRDELIEEAAKEAYASLKAEIITLKIAESEGIEVSDAEIEARIERIASATNVDKDVLKKRYQDRDRLDDIKQQIVEEKVVSFLHNSAVKE